MTNDEYTAAMTRVTAVSKLLAEEPLRELLDAVEVAQAVGPIVAPTAYVRGGGKNLQDQERLLRKALELQAVVRSIRESATA